MHSESARWSSWWEAFEPRKNQLAVLHATEKLWRGGLDFELTFICGSEWGTEIPDRIDELAGAGRGINVHRHADSTALEKAYHAARFSVFPSKHEGYGLPVVESLAAGDSRHHIPILVACLPSQRKAEH